MSLAELFGIKETWRQRFNRARRDWFRSHLAHQKSQPSAISHQRSALQSAHRSSFIPRHFLLESLEPRVLLNATPTPLVLPVEGIAESPSGPAADSSQGGTAAPLVQIDGSVPGSSPITHHSSLAGSYGNLPLSFEANHGQTDGAVEFLARGQGYGLFFTQTEAVLSLAMPAHASGETQGVIGGDSALSPPAVLRLELLGANESATITGTDQLEGRVNYLIGSDATQWHTDIPTYGQVFYDEVYDGIDLVFYGNQQQLEYDWIVAPGADASQIGLGISGADAAIDAGGNLEFTVAGGTVELLKPYAYQMIDGVKHTVDASFVLSFQQSPLSDQSIAIGSSSTVRLQLGTYDAALSLIIDPILTYSTYLGGSGDDQGIDIAVDTSGNTYVAGYTNSTNFPTQNASQPTHGVDGGTYDAFVTKLNAAGALVYSTYLGGNGQDNGFGLAVDASGNAYVTGVTNSSNFPTTLGANQSANGGGDDAFVAKLNTFGALVYSTYLGGSGNDDGHGIDVDAAGNAYVTGATTSANFPTQNPSQPTNGGNSDAFVTKLNPTGLILVYSTYLGDSGDDVGYEITVDALGNNAYVVGYTNSTNFPTTLGASQTANGGSYDAFITKLNTAGTARVYSTYLGGSGADSGYSLAVDAAGNAYVTGYTYSVDFPTQNASQPTNGGNSDAFVTKLNAAGAALLYSTYLGGSGHEQGAGIALDAIGNAYVTGATTSTNFPTQNASQPVHGIDGLNYDAFVTKLNAAGTALLYSTYLGGNGFDQGTGIDVDVIGNAYVTGATQSNNFPTAGTPVQGNLSGGAGTDGFIVKLLGPTKTWDGGGGNSDWGNADNWENNALPGLGDIVSIPSGVTVTSSGMVTIAGLLGLGNLTVSAGSFTITGASALDGTLTLSGGMLTANGATILTALTQSGGTLDGAGTVTVTGATNWSGGAMSGIGTTKAQGGLHLSGAFGPGAKFLSGGRVLEHEGIGEWTGTGQLIFGGGNGTFRLVSGIFTVGDAVDTQGTQGGGTGAVEVLTGATLRKSNGSNLTIFNLGVTSFTNAGTVEVASGRLMIGTSGYQQTAGLTKLTGGSFTVIGTLVLAGGSLTGTGTVTATTVSNTGGTVGPGLSPGMLTISGVYIQGNNGTLNIEVGGTVVGDDYDRLNIINGFAALSGTLNVTLINGFTPAFGDSFTFMSGSFTGDFTTKTIPPQLRADAPGITSYTLSANLENDAPAGTDKTVVTLEDTPYSFTSADFGFTDPNDSPANGFQAVMITTLPAAGTLTLNGNPVNADDVIIIPQAGVTWTAHASDGNYISVASSADGMKLVAADTGGFLYTSTDFGVTWTPRPIQANWFSVASSADGTKLVAGVHAGGKLWTSTDSGVHWIDHESNRNWISVASSADGTKLVAADYDGFLYTSTDSGGNWAPHESSQLWYAVASSADGTKLVAGVNGGFLYTSTDSGETWAPHVTDSNRQWYDVASSADGTKLVAAAGDGLYTSTDSGVNWTAHETTKNWLSVASSADGTRLIATSGETILYTSADSGVTWTPRTAPIGFLEPTWYDVASSADGTRLAATKYGGQLYTSVASPGLVYTPEANASGARVASFTFQVQDDGGTANTGVDLDQTPNTIILSVTAQNDAPTAIQNLVSVPANTQTSLVLTGSDVDLDTLQFTVASGPAHGTLSGPNFNLGLATNFAAGSEPDFVTRGDFNGDGALDLAVSNFSSDTVSVLLGTGTGSFGAATNFAVGDGPFGVAVGDFSGDGQLDLVVTNSNSSTISILLGDGTGSFGAATNFAVGAAPQRMAVGDFNGDGKQDLAVVNINSNDVSILLGTGTGSFAAAVNIAVGQGPYSVASADLNGDGKQDLVTTGRFTVSILLGDGTGSFGAATNIAAVSDPYAVAIADLNGDGKPDLAVTNQGSSNVGILLGTGTGSFGAATTFAVQATRYAVAIADLNGDGKPDLALSGNGLSTVSVLLGDGTGSFGAATTFVAAGSTSYSVALGDFNGDGKPDLAVANGGSGNSVSVLLNTTSVTYTPSTNFIGVDIITFTVDDGIATSAPAGVRLNVVPIATYMVTTTNDSGAGSLRQAIIDANNSPGLDGIAFAIGTGGLQSIALTSALPPITEAVFIDGTTQPGFSGTPIIELNGAGVVVNGLTIMGSGSTVRGLVINRFSGSGILLTGAAASGNVIEGNFIGTNAAGTSALANGSDGINIQNGALNNTIGGLTSTPGTGAGNVISGNGQNGIHILNVSGHSNLIQGNLIGLAANGTTALGNGNGGAVMVDSGAIIGGIDPLARNIISANAQAGVWLSNSGSNHGVVIQGNYIGTDLTGTVARGNGTSGVLIGSAPGTILGGTTVGAGNVISGNGYIGGVNVFGNSGAGVLIQGNKIGVGADGATPLGNLGVGVGLDAPFGNSTVGGTSAGAGNIIANNSLAGVEVSTTVGNAIEGNSIYSNGQLGIDLGSNGVTANDLVPLDPDSGPNNLQNFPVLTGVASGASGTTVTGTLNSTATSTFIIELFSNAVGDPSGFGEGQVFLGRTSVTTNSSGDGAFTLTLPIVLSTGQVVTATATDAGGNTSEFSAGVPVSNTLVVTYSLNVTVNGQGSGTVTSWGAGINSGAATPDLTESYPSGTQVTLEATPTTGVFLGWSDNGYFIPALLDPTTGRYLHPVSMLTAHNVTATFGLVATEPVPEIPKAPQGTSLWTNSVTFTWYPVTPPPGFDLWKYIVAVGYASGQHPNQIEVMDTAHTTTLTLFDRQPVPHYFVVTALSVPTGILPLTTQHAELAGSAALELAAVTPTADGYAFAPGTTLSTVKATGVLANDGTATTATLVTGPTRGTLVGGLKTDGFFTYTPGVPGDSFTNGTDTFTYRASDGTTTSGPITVTLAVAQQSGTTPEGTVTPQSGLTGWSVRDDGNLNGPSNWNGAQAPVLTQLSSIDSTEAPTSLLQRGTLLALTAGLPQQRTDYTLTFTLKSSSTGALGVLFRYTPDSTGGPNYSGYRFSMDQSAGYMRLVKIVGGQVVGNPLKANAVAYQPNGNYTLTISATTISATETELTLSLLDPTSATNLLSGWTVRDSSTPLNGTGLALYSANNPGGFYNLLGAQFDGAPPPTNAVVEVLTAGTGTGTISSNPGGLVLPGSPAATYTAGQTITLTAIPTTSLNSTFSGWSGLINPATGQIANLPAGVTTVTATFGGTPRPALTLDVDANGQASALQDGIVLVRHLSGVTGTDLTAGAIGANAHRTTPADLTSYLGQGMTSMLDVDNNGQASALQDGIILVRFLSGVRGADLTAGAIGAGAKRTDPVAIAAYLQSYLLGVGVQGASAQSASLVEEPSVVSSQPSALFTTTSSLQPLVLPSDGVQIEALITQSARLFDEPSAINDQPSVPDTSLITDLSLLPEASAPSPQPAALPNHAELSTQNSELAEGDAVAATQLSTASIQSAPWVARFLASEKDEDFVVTL